MGLLDDLWNLIPNKLKIIIGLAIFVAFGKDLMRLLVGFVNVGISGLNLVLLAGGSEPFPLMQNLTIYGVQITYYVVLAFIFFVPLTYFALNYYSTTKSMG